MLDKIRKKKNSLGLTIVIFAVVVVMAFFGLGPSGGPGSGKYAPAAWVDGEVITNQDFQEELQRRLFQYQSVFGAQYNEELIENLQIPQQTLEGLIQRKLLAQQAKRMDLIVSDEELASFIRSLPSFHRNGKFDNQLYQQIPDRGVRERRFREALEVDRLRQYLEQRIRLTQAEVRRGYQLRETKVNLRFAKIDFDVLTAKYTPSKKEVTQALKSNGEPQFKEYYESHRRDFTTPAEVKIRQIRVGIPFKASEAQKKKAKEKIEAITKEANSENFAEIAKKKSDDEYAKKGGGVGWKKRGTFAQAIETAIDTLQIGKVSTPIETEYGYFLIQLVDKKEEVTKPLEAVKNDIAKEFAKDKYLLDYEKKKLERWQGQLAKGTSIEADLRKLKIDIKKTGDFSLERGYIPQIGNADTILDAIFTLTKQAPIGKKLFEYGGAHYYIRLESIEHPKTKDFEKNEQVVEAAMASALQNQIMSQWISELQKKATIKRAVRFKPPAPSI